MLPETLRTACTPGGRAKVPMLLHRTAERPTPCTEYARGGLGPDGDRLPLALILRHPGLDSHPALDNGAMKLIFADMLAAARQLGVSRVSVIFVAFRAPLARGERVGEGPFLRAWFYMLLFLSRWWRIVSLYRAKAALQAEGFLNLPRPTARPRRTPADTAVRTGARS